ncbi:MAG: bifunctional acetate--CoA ligase family protein/GNAT family N-acetyltransferase [Burkholderiales bacterium]|nr:bifunctional acetate--CoA ligase family protein/GNAT family N-acetyltransferase [Burkholderiales bacterium]HMM50076.1 bifunctional acetate--CoA ligase family protein/GNAT family N-acetyltransferase [Burkholderiaceae bacterium]
MSLRNLVQLFDPRSVAVIGASNAARHVGNVLMRNLLDGGIAGPIMPVNPKYRAVAGVLAYRDVASLPETPELAVVCSPDHTVPDVIEALGERGSAVAVIVNDGLARRRDAAGRSLRDGALEAARRHGMRLLGPGSLGVLVPHAGLNASLSHVSALPGRLAFVSQSGAICTAVLDWARAKGIGFSHFVALGDCVDIDFGDVLDYLGTDPDTSAILLYIDEMAERGNFMAAARAAARNKPVLAVKSGRGADLRDDDAAPGARGVLARPDEVFDAALRRAGVLRVYDIDELFAAVETLGRARTFRGEHLAILHNGGGTGVMAVDELRLGGGRCAQLSPETCAKLAASLPEGAATCNPLDLGVNASGQRYAQCLKTVLADPGVNAALVVHAPTATTASEEIAQAVIGVARELSSARILTSWVGARAMEQARRLFAQADLPTYDTPSSAVKAFLHVMNFHRNQEMLMQMPPSLPSEFQPDVAAARAIVERALARGDGLMTEPDAKAALAAYGIPVVETRIADSVERAAALAAETGFPLALAVVSPDIAHRWDVGGVALHLESVDEVRAAAAGMVKRIGELMPAARIAGFTLQRMVPRTNARQLFIAVADDPLFGPVIVFGEGGRAVEVLGDHAVGFPPLNLPLARELISRTRIDRRLQSHRDRPAADIDALCLALVKVSQMVVDMPEIVELDINPLFADERGVTCVDAHMRVRPVGGRESRLAIRPYPKGLEQSAQLRDGREILLRPIRPEDEPAHHALIARMSPEDLRLRFFSYVRELRHAQMARLTQVDYDREMAFIATAPDEQGEPETLGVVRTVTDPDNESAEFAVLVRSDLKGQGLGHVLMKRIIDYCRSRGTAEIKGLVLASNESMLGLARRLGFRIEAGPEADTVVARLSLR